MATPIKILITGFEPFGGLLINPSGDVALSLSSDSIDGVDLYSMILPVEYHRAMQLIRERVGCYDAIVMLGVARTRQEVSIERVAINLMDAASPDNSGYCPDEVTICPGASSAYFSTIPVKSLAAAVKACGIPCKVSNSAGTYVCNAVFYAALHEASINHDVMLLPSRTVFVHLPSEKVLPINDMCRAVTIILKTIANL